MEEQMKDRMKKSWLSFNELFRSLRRLSSQNNALDCRALASSVHVGPRSKHSNRQHPSGSAKETRGCKYAERGRGKLREGKITNADGGSGARNENRANERGAEERGARGNKRDAIRGTNTAGVRARCALPYLRPSLFSLFSPSRNAIFAPPVIIRCTFKGLRSIVIC